MYNNKVDKILDLIVEDMDAKQLWKIVFNKMTNQAKRQVLNEVLNQYLGGYTPIEGSLFKHGGEN